MHSLFRKLGCDSRARKREQHAAELFNSCLRTRLLLPFEYFQREIWPQKSMSPNQQFWWNWVVNAAVALATLLAVLAALFGDWFRSQF